jgi:hypothetical protein
MTRHLIHPRAALRVAPLALAVAFAAGTGSAQAAFPGANGKIAYLNKDYRVFVANADGTGVIGPLTPASTPATAPRWSPDGRQLVFSLHSFSSGGESIVVMNADGTGLRPVAISGATTLNGSPSWTADGHIVFSRVDPSTYVASGIWSVEPDGTGLQQLTTGADFEVSAAPNGTLAFTRHPASGGWVIYVSAADGSSAHALDTLTDVQVDSPSWAPDSSKVAFEVADPVNDTDGGIYVINADGTGQVRIKGNAEGSHPAFSPDGTQIAYAMPDAVVGADGIGSMRPDGSGSQMVLAPTAGGGGFEMPEWGGVAQAPTTTTPPAIGPTWPPSPKPVTTGKSTVSATTTAHLAAVLSRGYSAQVSCDRACAVTGALLLPRSMAHKVHLARASQVTIGTGSAHLASAGTVTLRVKLSRSARRKLAHQHRLHLTLRVVTTSGSVVTTVSKQIAVS